MADVKLIVCAHRIHLPSLRCLHVLNVPGVTVGREVVLRFVGLPLHVRLGIEVVCSWVLLPLDLTRVLVQGSCLG